MRTRPLRTALPSLLLLPLLLLPLLAACGGGDKGMDTKTSCLTISDLMTSIGTAPLQNMTGTANVDQFAKTYADAADKIRAAAARSADKQVRDSAVRVADALDLLTKEVSSRETTGSTGLAATGRLADAALAFKRICP
jgi:hypothetical protein